MHVAPHTPTPTHPGPRCAPHCAASAPSWRRARRCASPRPSARRPRRRAPSGAAPPPARSRCPTPSQPPTITSTGTHPPLPAPHRRRSGAWRPRAAEREWRARARVRARIEQPRIGTRSASEISRGESGSFWAMTRSDRGYIPGSARALSFPAGRESAQNSPCARPIETQTHLGFMVQVFDL